MSTEQQKGSSIKKDISQGISSTSQPTPGLESTPPQAQQPASPPTPPTLSEESALTGDRAHDDRKPSAKRDFPHAGTSQSTPGELERPRQVIAVSASKGPTAFFNLARKFLVTDELCDLSALEGAIVSAVDAAHLLERSKLATIVRVQTSYVTVEPKRRKQTTGSPPQYPSTPAVSVGTSALPPASVDYNVPTQARPKSSSGRELRRARIVITVRRTDSYKQWLEENPLHAIMAGEDAEEDDDDHHVEVEDEHAEEGITL